MVKILVSTQSDNSWISTKAEVYELFWLMYLLEVPDSPHLTERVVGDSRSRVPERSVNQPISAFAKPVHELVAMQAR